MVGVVDETRDGRSHRAEAPRSSNSSIFPFMAFPLCKSQKAMRPAVASQLLRRFEDERFADMRTTPGVALSCDLNALFRSPSQYALRHRAPSRLMVGERRGLPCPEAGCMADRAARFQAARVRTGRCEATSKGRAP